MVASNENIAAGLGVKLADAITTLKTMFDKVLCLKETNLILTHDLEFKSESLIEADEKVKKLESLVAEQKDQIQRLQVKIDHFSEDSQVVTSSVNTVSTATQTSVDITGYNDNCLQCAEAADKIHKLEDKLDEKLTYIIKLKNKLTCYRLRENPQLRLRPNYNILADLEENSSAGVQGAIEAGLNDAPIKKDQIKTEACFNNQEHLKPHVEEKSANSKRTPQANSIEANCASSELQSSAKKETSETAALSPPQKDDKPKLDTAQDNLFAEVSTMSALWKSVRELKKTYYEQSDLGSAPPTEADTALPPNEVSPSPTEAGTQSGTPGKKKRRRRCGAALGANGAKPNLILL